LSHAWIKRIKYKHSTSYIIIITARSLQEIKILLSEKPTIIQ